MPEISAVPQNPLLGLLARALAGVGEAAKRAKALGEAGGSPMLQGAGALLDTLVGEKPRMVEDASYGFGPTRGTGLARNIKPEYAGDVADLVPGPGDLSALAKWSIILPFTKMIRSPSGLPLFQVTGKRLAREMTEKGAHPADVWEATKANGRGWWPMRQGSDPRTSTLYLTELPDNEVRTTGPTFRSFYDTMAAARAHPARPLESVLLADQLDLITPEFRNIRIHAYKGGSGGFYRPQPGTGSFGPIVIGGDTSNDFEKGVLHELTHAASDISGGLSPQGANFGNWINLMGNKKGLELYRAKNGEAIAQIGEDRHSLTPKQRDGGPPWADARWPYYHNMEPGFRQDMEIQEAIQPYPTIPARFENLRDNPDWQMLLDYLYDKNGRGMYR